MDAPDPPFTPISDAQMNNIHGERITVDLDINYTSNYQVNGREVSEEEFKVYFEGKA